MSANRRASTGRAARGRRNSAGCRRRSEKTEVHQSETHKSIQEEEPAGEPTATEKLNSEGPKRGRRRVLTKHGSVSEEEERIEERREVELTCRDTVESTGSEREDVEMKQNSGQEEMEKEPRQNSGLHEEVEKNDEDLTPASVPSETLESWQQPDFCIEDILKPVAKSRVSVRRSLRHRRSMDVLAKGLAWVEHTSPQMITTSQRRKTRGRLSAVSQPPPLPDPQENPSERALTEEQL